MKTLASSALYILLSLSGSVYDLNDLCKLGPKIRSLNFEQKINSFVPWQEAGFKSVAPAPERQTGHGTGSDPRTDLARKDGHPLPRNVSVFSQKVDLDMVFCVQPLRNFINTIE